MLTEAYIEALLVDEDLADQVLELLDAGVITDGLAVMARWLIQVETIQEMARAIDE
jgi:hypothetical protein